MTYRGRFAPSSTGPLHLGSIVAALASWLDARAHQGQWLVRIEDIDTQRCKPEFTEMILAQLAAFDLQADSQVTLQSNNLARHQQALHALRARGQAFACGCSRAAIAARMPAHGASGEPVYPGTCRNGMHGGALRSWRLQVANAPLAALPLAWHDRWLGVQHQELAAHCGDFVLADANEHPSYHLACVLDDAAAGITDIVRGADLAALTPRQIFLQRQLGLPTPRYLHVPVLTDAQGHKLSKQSGASAVDTKNPLPQLRAAAMHLGLQVQHAQTAPELLAQAVQQWQERWNIRN